MERLKETHCIETWKEEKGNWVFFFFFISIVRLAKLTNSHRKEEEEEEHVEWRTRRLLEADRRRSRGRTASIWIDAWSRAVSAWRASSLLPNPKEEGLLARLEHNRRSSLAWPCPGPKIHRPLPISASSSSLSRRGKKNPKFELNPNFGG